MPTHHVTLRELRRGLTLQTNQRHVIKVRLPALTLRLPIDPGAIASHDDRFVLQVDGPAGHEEIVKTIKDDAVPGDRCVDLVFGKLRPQTRYTLTVDLGEGQPVHTVFEGLTIRELARPRDG